MTVKSCRLFVAFLCALFEGINYIFVIFSVWTGGLYFWEGVKADLLAVCTNVSSYLIISQFSLWLQSPFQPLVITPTVFQLRSLIAQLQAEGERETLRDRARREFEAWSSRPKGSTPLGREDMASTAIFQRLLGTVGS